MERGTADVGVRRLTRWGRGGQKAVAWLAWAGVVCFGGLGVSAPAPAESARPERVLDPELALIRSNGSGNVLPGETVVVQLWMRFIEVENPAAGYQAFLEFDPSLLEFVSATYTASPFGLHIIDPIGVNGNQIDVAAGIDQLGGQTPATGSEVLAELTFTSLALRCKPAVTFRTNTPPSRITQVGGTALPGLRLRNPIADCPCEWNCMGILNSQDFFDFVTDFFNGTGDYNMDEIVNSQDFFDYLGCFFMQPEFCEP